MVSLDGLPSAETLRERFARYGQSHVFRFWDRLDPTARGRLAAQAEALDLAGVEHARQSALGLVEAPRELSPARIERLPEHGGDAQVRTRARECGEALLAAGSVAALVVAGGQGTRLGFPGPKGAFRLGPISDRSLFGQQAQKLRGLVRRYGRRIPWYVMTSEATASATRELFAREEHFGLPEDDVIFFSQASMPALDEQGRLVLEAPDRIAVCPNGHGGMIPALKESGALADMAARGIRRISYYQVDNPLVRIADPVLLGLHALREAEVASKVVRKRDPYERAGVVARWDGRVGVVEYTELDDLHRHEQDGSGELVYWAAAIAVHVLDVAFVGAVAADADRILPYHASPKKIPRVDEQGLTVVPDEPNGYKLERFVFDALPAARAVAVLEIRREEEYSPIKNASGGESPETARRDLVACYRRWLEAGGIPLPHDAAAIELDQSRIDGPEDARRACGEGVRGPAGSKGVIRIETGGSG